jgi:hypothetical protein
MTKWATFTHSGQEIRRISKLLQGTSKKMALRTQNTIGNILKPHAQTGKYNRSGIYQMKCVDYPLKYSGKTVVTMYDTCFNILKFCIL